MNNHAHIQALSDQHTCESLERQHPELAVIAAEIRGCQPPADFDGYSGLFLAFELRLNRILAVIGADPAQCDAIHRHLLGRVFSDRVAIAGEEVSDER